MMADPSDKASNEHQNQASNPVWSDSLSKPVPLPLTEAHRVIPYDRNINFTHRLGIASRLDSIALQRPHDCRGIALWGSSGFGKTQIALDLAYRRSEDPTCFVFWVCASGRNTFMRDFKKISIRLGLNTDLRGENLLKAVCESIESKSQWLLVLDGADDLACLGGNSDSSSKKSEANLLDYVPSSGTGTTFWTSCDRGILGIVGSGAIHVHQMTYTEASKVFEMAINHEISDAENTSTIALIDELGRHPLAILQAGVYSQLTSTKVDQYVLELNRIYADGRINIFTDSDIETDFDVSRRVIKAVNISIQYIREQSWIACNVLHVLSYLSNKRISSSIIRAVASTCTRKDPKGPNIVEQEMEAALILLRKYHFLYMATEEDGDLHFEMPKIIQQVAQVTSASKNRITKAGIAIQTVQVGRSEGPQSGMADADLDVSFFRIALETMEYCLNRAPQDIDTRWDKYLSHVLRLSKLAENKDETTMAVRLLNVLSEHFSKNEMWENMTLVAMRAVELTIEVLGEEHAETLWNMGNLGSSFYQQGRYDEAEDLLEHLLRLRRHVLGPEHPHTMWTMSSLGVTYGMRDEHSKAEKMFLSLISLQGDTVGERHPDTIVSMCNLAATYHSQRCYDQAEELLISVLALTTTESQHENLNMSQVRYKLSMVQQSRALEDEKSRII